MRFGSCCYCYRANAAVITSILSILQIRKVRLQEVNFLAHVYTVIKGYR